MDLYRRLGEELRSLFADMFNPKQSVSVKVKIAKIVITATEIGGTIEAEALRLNDDVLKFLENRGDPNLASLMKEHALRLEQETREI